MGDYVGTIDTTQDERPTYQGPLQREPATMVALVNSDGSAGGTLPLVVDHSGSIVAKNVAQDVFQERNDVRSRYFSNQSGVDMWIKECAPGNAADKAAVATPGNVRIAAGGNAEIFSGNRLSVISDAQNAVGAIYTAKEA